MFGIFYFCIFSMFIKQYVTRVSVYMKLPIVNVTRVNVTAHLELKHIKNICKNSKTICKSNMTRVCAMRHNNNKFEYEDFENSCFLFLSNMCEHPGKEFAIVESESCNTHLKSRRHYEVSGVTVDTPNVYNSSNDTSSGYGNTTRPGLRGFSFSTLYDVEFSHDQHPCPMSCPNVYAPVCVNVNKGLGKYLKFFQFVNHCESDRYYCMNWEEFEQPPGYSAEKVDDSPLGWSFCGASRYLQFSLMSQTASSMGHYGWLKGNHRYSKILEPWQRKPGYG